MGPEITQILFSPILYLAWTSSSMVVIETQVLYADSMEFGGMLHRRTTPTIYYDDLQSRKWDTYTVNGHDSIGLQPKKSMTFAQTFK